MHLTQRIAGRAKRLAGKATGNRRLERRGRRQAKKADRKARRAKRLRRLAAAGGVLALSRRKRERPTRRRGKANEGDEAPPTRLVRRTVTTVDTYVEARDDTGDH